MFNPKFAVETYCGAKSLAATLVSRFCFSTDLWICLGREIAPTARFAEGFESVSLSEVYCDFKIYASQIRFKASTGAPRCGSCRKIWV